MNFKEAYKVMQAGKKIRRPDWEEYKYYSLIEDDIYFVGKIIVQCVTIEDSLADDWEILQEKKWLKPEKNTYYYILNIDGSVERIYYTNSPSDNRAISIGNCFRTEEEAKFMSEKLKVLHELEKFSCENNSEEIDWANKKQNKYYLVVKYKKDGTSCIDVFYTITLKDIPFNVYFTREDFARKAIEVIGEERIKKYFFNIK